MRGRALAGSPIGRATRKQVSSSITPEETAWLPFERVTWPELVLRRSSLPKAIFRVRTSPWAHGGTATISALSVAFEEGFEGAFTLRLARHTTIMAYANTRYVFKLRPLR
jgi:hypothetical protein